MNNWKRKFSLAPLQQLRLRPDAFTPRATAKARLRHIIPMDRERVPAWRWVPSTYFWRGMPITGLCKNGKPMYCWERRR